MSWTFIEFDRSRRVRVQTVQPFFHYKSENENGITIRYPFLHFSIKNENEITTC